MKKPLRRKCYGCETVFDVVNEEVFFSVEAKNSSKVFGVAYVEDAFASEIHGDTTKRWECSRCWWQGWWDI